MRTAEVRYDKTQETNRYVGTVQARHEVDQAFRVGGKVVQRKVDVGQKVREGDVLAVLDDTDYRLAEEAAQQQLVAAHAQARQAESDRQRLDALKTDGSVSASDDEKAQSGAQTARRRPRPRRSKLELARNRLKYTVLRASQSGVVTAVRFEVGQVVAEGQPIVSIANEGEPEIVVDVPEDQLAAFKTARYKASLASAPDQDVRRRAARTVAAGGGADANLPRPPEARRRRGRCRSARPPRSSSSARSAKRRRRRSRPSAITQNKGQPAVWVVRRAGTEPVGTVDLMRVVVHGYRNDEVLVSGPPAGELVVTAGVQKMAPGLRVALPGAPRATPTRSRPPDEVVQPHRMGAEPPRHRAVPDPRDRHRRRAGLHEARPARRPELLGAVDDRDGDLARRHRAADPGRGAQPHGEEVRAARPLREGRDLCAPGLRRHDDHGRRRHVARRTSARRGTRRARSSATSSSSCPKASSARSSTTNTAT